MTLRTSARTNSLQWKKHLEALHILHTIWSSTQASFINYIGLTEEVLRRCFEVVESQYFVFKTWLNGHSFDKTFNVAIPHTTSTFSTLDRPSPKWTAISPTKPIFQARIKINVSAIHTRLHHHSHRHRAQKMQTDVQTACNNQKHIISSCRENVIALESVLSSTIIFLP